MNVNELFQGAFGYNPKNKPTAALPVPLPEPPEPEKRSYNTRDSVVRDNPPDTAAAVQQLVWGSGVAPVGAPNQLPAPAGGVVPAISKESGWGKTSG